MLDNIFSGLFDSSTQSVIAVGDFVLCLLASLALGFLLAFCCTYKNRTTKSFSLAIALLPAAVCVVIMLVNGNIGAGVAVAGAFGLVRFRSAPGTAKEIVAIFTAMATGLIAGMGYIAYAALFTVIMSVIFIILAATGFGDRHKASLDRDLKITVPEDLNITGAFDDILARYTAYCRRTSIKTANMGSMFKLRYDITLKNADDEKALIDELRERNGNLEIVICEKESKSNEL